MVIEVFKCDNKNCGHIAENMKKVCLGAKEYDLCEKCVSALSCIVEVGFDDSVKANLSDSEIKVPLLEPKKLREITSIKNNEKETPSNKKSQNMMSMLDEIGRDVIRHEYIEEGLI